MIPGMMLVGQRRGSVPWTPMAYFAAGEQGALYDHSDLSTQFQDSAGTVAGAIEQPIGKVLDKSGRGNHATQDATASKPTLSARANLYLSTELITDSTYWSYNDVTVTASGGMFKVTEGTTDTAHVVMRPSILPAVVAQRSFSVEAKADTRSWMVVYSSALSTVAYFDLANGVLGTVTGGTATITALGGGLYRCRVSGSSDDTSFSYGPSTGNGVRTYLGNGTGAILVNKPHVQMGDHTSYQRVTTTTDYDAAGFPHYVKLDRVDDFKTAAGGGGGTTGIIVCAAIKAGGAGTARTIWSDQGTNTGYRLSINATDQLVLSAGNGTAYTDVVGPALIAGQDYVVTGWHDGANLNLRVNLGTITSAAFGTATAGTAGFTVGRDNGAATGYFGDRIHGMLYRKNDSSTAAERDKLIRYMADKQGVVL